MRKLFTSSAIAAFLMSGVAYAGHCNSDKAHSHETDAEMAGSNEKAAEMAAQMDIVETAIAAESFTTLVAAVKAAGLVEVLQGEGPFTVFAPTDEAFGKLPEGTLEGLLKDKEALTAILTYHVVNGRVPAEKVVTMKAAKTVNGQKVDVTVKDGNVMIDNATVVKTDIMTSNGIIHVIDAVILPDMEK